MDQSPSRRSPATAPTAAAAGRPAPTRLVAVLAVLALTLAALVTGAASAGPARATNVEDVFTTSINEERAARGVRPLTTRPHLVAVARRWAARMAEESRLYHNPRLTSAVNNWRWVGENVGYGPDAATVHAAFMGSSGHKANILDRDYTEMGVGAVVSDGRVWVAEVFRQPQRARSTSRATATSASVSEFSQTLRVGSRGAAVKAVQDRLGLRTTGYYGADTSVAVARFQKRQGWAGRGSCGPKTWSRLF